MLNSVPSSLYSNIGGLFLFLSGGATAGAQNGGGSAVAVAITAVAGLAVVAAVVYTRSGNVKSPWSRKRIKNALTPEQWRNSFQPDGKLHDGGINLLKKVRSGGIDHSVRAEVWPFLLGVYDLDSTEEEREAVRNRNRKEYEKLRRQSRRLLRQTDENLKPNSNAKSEITEPSSPASEVVSAHESLCSERGSSDLEFSENHSSSVLDRTSSSQQITSSTSVVYDSSEVGSSEDEQFYENSPLVEHENEHDVSLKGNVPASKTNMQSNVFRSEDFATWQRIIRLDAVRANAEWIAYSPSQAAISEDRARCCAEAVGLKDYDHLEPCRVFHAARLVAILEAYAIYDSEIGYCQGMSDLLSPIISVIEEDHMAFWCFVGFMKKARHNFRLDEVGIRRQLNIVAKIIKYKDSHLYRHLVKLQAEDCFFVYRMVVVLFRRELNFEQTLCLWEVMWADQAALRSGVGKTAWSRIRQRAPPTEDLLLYAIAASVLQRRKQFIEKYNSMDEILRECNNMAGQLDVWKLLDDAHHLVMTLHDKIDATV
ncbi:rab GTPase-activating protein 22-like [Amaranthus tricolor]|uniref:rab GTPase-activating protein 22-like n=1 Tax=Amaranthus tricolor TaxID=29722 RepID=UPI002582F0D8|nr:rab GTPase-activating protein 22-like [Amaranthus tricolor]